jgi:hypothetical protein
MSGQVGLDAGSTRVNDLRPLDFEVFSGGMADIDTPNDRRTGELVENFDITPQAKLKQRPGSRILDDTATLIDASTGVRTNGQLGSIINYEDDLHVVLRAKDSLYAKNEASWTAGTAWTKLAGPNTGWEALPAFKALTAAAVVSSVPWKGHEILVGKDESAGSYISPQKVYLDDSSQFKVLNAGLPAPADPAGFQNRARVLTQACYLANDIKTQLNTHIADTTMHASATTLVTKANATSEQTLLDLTADILQAYNTHVNLEYAAGGWSAHRIDQIINVFGYDATLLTASLNYLAPYVPAPESIFEAARILNQVLWAANLHFIAFMDPPNTVAGSQYIGGSAVVWDTAANTATFTGADDYRTGDPIRFWNLVPTPLVLGTTYYAIKAAAGDGKIKVATTAALAAAGTPIDITSTADSGVIRDLTALHTGTPTPAIQGVQLNATLTSPPVGYAYPEGFGIISGYYPHISTAFYTDASTLFNDTLFHLNQAVGTQHAADASRTYFASLVDGYNNVSGKGPYDWQVFAQIVKSHAALRQHRMEKSSYYHVANDESALTLLSVSKSVYTQKYAPSPFDNTTWETVRSLLEDAAPKLVTHVSQGVGRHSGGSVSITITLSSHVWTQRRYALVYAHQYKTYKNLVFKVRSAPTYSDSYAIGHVFNDKIAFSLYLYSVVINLEESLALENYDAANIDLEVYRRWMARVRSTSQAQRN